jgi:rhodanese-related sulfurtransferase/rubrerythrin
MRWKQFITPVESLDAEGLREFMDKHREGTYTLLDVRQPGEYEESRIPGAKLIPLPELNERLEELPGQEPIIAYCAVGGRSRAAAQFLSGKGFEKVYNLRGGIKAWQGHKASGPPETGMTTWTGKETPAEVIQMAYGMESGLGSFYNTMADTSDNPGLRETFRQLAGIEDRHKQKLAQLFEAMNLGGTDFLENEISTDRMEGGYTTEEFLEQYGSSIDSVPRLLDLAMMLEAQALDLYSRYAQSIADPQGKAILTDIAQEEKGHLAALGRLMEENAGLYSNG